VNDAPVTICLVLPAELAEELRITAQVQRLTVAQLIGAIVADVSCDPVEVDALVAQVKALNQPTVRG
jgi:hypothetical protein